MWQNYWHNIWSYRYSDRKWVASLRSFSVSVRSLSVAIPTSMHLPQKSVTIIIDSSAPMTSGQVGISREVHGRYRDMSPSLSPRFFLTIRTTRYHLSDICFALIAFVLSPLIGLKYLVLLLYSLASTKLAFNWHDNWRAIKAGFNLPGRLVHYERRAMEKTR